MSSPEHSDKSPCQVLEMPVNNASPTGSAGSDKDVEKKKKSKNKEGKSEREDWWNVLTRFGSVVKHRFLF